MQGPHYFSDSLCFAGIDGMRGLARGGNASLAYLVGQNGRGYSSTIGQSDKADRCTLPA